MTATHPHTVPDTGAIMTRNRIVAPIILGIAILLAILITRPIYMSYIEKKATTLKLENDYKNLSSEYESLLAIKNNTRADTISAQVEKISKKIDRADLMSTIMLNDYTKESLESGTRITISSMSLSDPAKLPNGLSLSTASISLQGRTVDEIIRYITYLTTESPYAFTLEDISLPIDTAPDDAIPGGYSMNLSLGVYSYE
jgi:hypothetical protein